MYGALPRRLILIPYYLASIVLADTFVLFVGSTMLRGSGDAWLIMTGSMSPLVGGPWYEETVTSGLAIAGYLLMPTMIGFVISIGIGDLIRSRRPTKTEFEDAVSELVTMARDRIDQAGSPGDDHADKRNDTAGDDVVDLREDVASSAPADHSGVNLR